MITGGADGFRDEDVLYATRLAEAGVPTDLCVISGAPHGAEMFLGTTPGAAAGRVEWASGSPRCLSAQP